MYTKLYKNGNKPSTSDQRKMRRLSRRLKKPVCIQNTHQMLLFNSSIHMDDDQQKLAALKESGWREGCCRVMYWGY